jgi:hypothetical protein
MKLSDFKEFYEPVPECIYALDRNGNLYGVMHDTGKLKHFSGEKPSLAWDRATIEDAKRVIAAGKARAKAAAGRKE